MKLRTAIYIYISILVIGGAAIVQITMQGLSDTNKIKKIWHVFEENRSEKTVALNDLRAELGFGGMIHNYKNYILRYESFNKEKTITHLGAVQARLQTYKTLNLNSAERDAVIVLKNTLDTYRTAVNKIQIEIDRESTPHQIDNLVKINDEPALRALQTLHQENNIATEFSVNSNKSNVVHTLRKAIGYGGLIHSFKNYILRGDALFRERAVAAYKDALIALNLYKGFDINQIESHAITTIENGLHQYHERLAVIDKLKSTGVSVGLIDDRVKVNDAPILFAFEDLNREIYVQSELDKQRLNTSIDSVVSSGNLVLTLTTISIFLVVVSSFWLVYFHIVKRISSLTRTMNVLAKDDTQVKIQWLENQDEIGDMSRALDVFRSNIILRKKAESELIEINHSLERIVEERTQALRENEQRLTALVETAVDSIITIDSKGHILSFNQAAISMFGYQLEEVAGKNVSMLMPEPYKSEHDGYLEKFHRTQNAEIIGVGREVYALRKDGSIFPMDLAVSRIESHGNVIFTGIIRDLTERRLQEEKIRRTQKMDALGKLTGGIAHDFNNMLGVILGFSEMLESKLQDSPKLLRYVTQINTAAMRSAKLTRKLLDFSRYKPEQKLSVVDLNTLILNSQDILEKSLTALIEIDFDLDVDAWDCYIDAEDMEDALLNLCINSMHAMPDGGNLKISTKNITLDETTSQKYEQQSGDYVRVDVEDTGVGMDESVLSHIFEPFFTTKESSGTGLGLSQVYGFVQRCHGEVTVVSEQGKGTCFSILLPRYLSDDMALDETDIVNKKAQSAHGIEKILVVDDEPSMCSLAMEILSHYGYEVMTVNSAKEAIDVLKVSSFDLVLTDVVMPEMDGFSLASYIKDTYPAIKILIVSGYNTVRLTEGYQWLADSVLNKPYHKSELTLRIRNKLDERKVSS